MRHIEPIYRIGLFGRSNAGKTSLLVALSEINEHVEVDDNSWTISYLQPVDGQFTDKEIFDKLKRGQQLLYEAKESIKSKRKPPPTDEKEKTTLYRFQLATGGSTRTLELWDYAGEILDLSRLDNVESYGYELGKRISDCDAVLVLAPASDDSDEAKVDAGRSLQIAKALAQLHAWIKKNDKLREVRRRPFALIVTKLDRVKQSQNATVERFGKSAVNVWETIRALVGSGVTDWFGLSTMGESADSSDLLKPLLLKPLIWAMNAADTEVIAMAQRADQLGLTGWNAKKQAANQLQILLRRRLPTLDVKDKIIQEAHGANESLNRSLRQYRIILVAATSVFFWLFLCIADKLWTDGYERIAKDASASIQKLKESGQYFGGYDTVPRGFSPLSLKTSAVTALLKSVRKLMADRQWQLIESEVDPIEKGKLAEDYRNDFPESEKPVGEIIIKAGEEAARRRYANWFDPLEIRGDHHDLTLVQRSELVDALASMPSDLIELKAQSDHRHGIVDRLRADQTKAITTADRKVFVEQLENLVQRKRPFEAMSVIKGKPDSLDWLEMAPTLLLMRENWQDDVVAYLSDFRKEGNFDTAIQALQIAIRDSKVIPVSVGLPDAPDLSRLLLDLQGEWDKSEYNEFKANPSVQLANEYQSAAHSKCMSSLVKKWEEWKQSESSARSLHPHLVSITWDKQNGTYHPLIDFYVNGQKIMDKQSAGNGWYGDTWPFAASSRSLEFDRNSPIECRIVLWDDDWPSNDDLMAEFSGTFRFSDLIQTQGKTEFLREGNATHTFRIRLVGMDQAPELLEWQPCK